MTTRIIQEPEEIFIIDQSTEKKIHVDATLCAIERARAVLRLIWDNGGESTQGFAVSHETIMNGLWSVSAMLEQAVQLLEYPRKK